jgi:superfamily II DNA or RNA helicase
LDALASGAVQVVVNVGILTEGWDCPRVSCVVLARPTKSLGLYLQMAGRALRPFSGKRDCIILDHGGNAYTHGLVTDPRFFSVEPESKIKDTIIPVKVCVKCFANYRGKICPSCGEISNNSDKIELPKVAAGNLIEFKQSVINIQERYYKDMLQIQYRQNKPDTWAAVQFKTKFNKWPPHKLTGNIWNKRRKLG